MTVYIGAMNSSRISRFLNKSAVIFGAFGVIQRHLIVVIFVINDRQICSMLTWWTKK